MSQNLTFKAPIGLPQGAAVRTVSQISGIPLNFEALTWKQINHPSFKENNPLSQLTVLQINEQTTLTEFNAILRYFARLAQSKGLYGDDAFEQAQVDSLLDYTLIEIQKMSFALVGPIYGTVPFIQNTYEAAKKDLFRLLQIIEDQLTFKTYLCSNRMTIGDISLFTSVFALYQYIITEEIRKQLPNVTRWFQNIAVQPVFQQNFGKYYPVSQEWQNEGQKLVSGLESSEPTQKQDKQQSGKQQKQQSQQQDGEKKLGRKELKKAQKAAEKAQKKAAESSNPDQKQEKQENKENKEKTQEKQENKEQSSSSTFNYFDFKTEITNTNDKKTVIENLLSNFDSENYSLWFVLYDKYEGEGEVLYMTSNLKDSFLQRMDSFRKESYGVLGVYGEEKNYDIQGVWMWKGTQIPEQTKNVPSFEYYNWTKLDLSKPEDKQKVFDCWCNLEENKSVFNGKVLRDVSLFK